MKKPHPEHALLVRRFIFGLFLFLAIPFSVCLAQEVTPITSSGLNTTVSPPGTLANGWIEIEITGGTRPGGGVNLFHSFGNFDVPNNNIATFLNDSGLATTNILGRVTGGNVSDIFGIIQTSGFGTANLFLVNPAGFLFGPSATINVGGMVAFTSAGYLRLADGALFKANPNGTADALLSAAPVAAFGFLGSNPGAITVQSGQLSVFNGTGFSLVGGNITVQAGELTALSGQINLVSVGKPSHSHVGGEVANGGEFAATGFKSLGTINLSQGSTIDTSAIEDSGQSGGPIVIRGGKFVMDNSSVTATNPTFFLGTSGGVGGNIEVTAEHVSLTNHSTIDTSTRNETSAGNITFNVGRFSATDSTIIATTPGVGGAVTIQGLQGSGTSAHAVALSNSGVSTSSNYGGELQFVVVGGPIVFRADNISLNQSMLATNAIDGDAGTIAFQSARRIESHGSTFNAHSAFNKGGTIDLSAGTAIDLTGTNISAQSSLGGSGTITLSAPFISLNSSGLRVTTEGFGPPGGISIAGRNAVSLTNGTVLNADNFWGPVPAPPPLPYGGNISIYGGASLTIDHSTISAGSPLVNGGTINLGATGIVSVNEALLTTAVSGGPQTVAGTITIDANAVKVNNSQILSTATEGQGGIIDITSHNRHPVTNSVINATSQFGTDGTVTIKRP